MIFKNCAPLTNCIIEIDHTQVDNANYLHVVMPMYSLIEYSDNYSKTSGSLWQYSSDEPNATLTDSESFKSKIKITANTLADGKILGKSDKWGQLEFLEAYYIKTLASQINFSLKASKELQLFK